jgi:hypothetical protein
MKKNTVTRFVLLALISIAILAASAQDFLIRTASSRRQIPVGLSLVASMNQMHADMHSVEPSGNGLCNESACCSGCAQSRRPFDLPARVSFRNNSVHIPTCQSANGHG